MLSVILPAYNEQEMIAIAGETISRILAEQDIPYEILFVDDGSRDNTWKEIQAAAERSAEIRGVSFSRNFGKEAAIFAGLSNARGDCCVVLDCDLQHPPEMIVEMYRLWEKGYEIVEGIKADRGRESFLYRLCARCFNRLMSGAMHTDMSRASDFKLLDRKVVDVLLKMNERNTFFRALSSWVGYRATTLEFKVQARKAGKSKWSGRSLLKYAVSNLTMFSTAPM